MAGNSGTLGRIDLVSPADLDKGSQELQVQDDVVRTVLEMGIPLPTLSADGFRGEMPADITTLDDDQLGSLLSKLSNYIGYVDAEVSKAQGARNAAEARLDFIKARVRIGLRAMQQELGRLTKTDKDDIVATDPRVVEAQADALYHESVYILSRTILHRAERDWDTVSRRITQRGQEIERMKREGNVAGVPAVARTFRRPGT